MNDLRAIGENLMYEFEELKEIKKEKNQKSY